MLQSTFPRSGPSAHSGGKTPAQRQGACSDRSHWPPQGSPPGASSAPHWTPEPQDRDAPLREALLGRSPQRAPCPGAAILLPGVSALSTQDRGAALKPPHLDPCLVRGGRLRPPAVSPPGSFLSPGPLATSPEGPQAPGLGQQQIRLRHWARRGEWGRYQPVGPVHRGFGEKVAFHSPGSVGPVPTPLRASWAPNLAFRVTSASRCPQGQARPGGSANGHADPSEASVPWPSSTLPSHFPPPGVPSPWLFWGPPFDS